MTNDLRERCKAMFQKMQRDAILRQGSPVDDLMAFVVAELEAELADLKKEREAVDALRKHEGTPTPEIMAWAEKTFMQAEIDDLKTQINILVNVGREVWSALQTNSDYTTTILSLADVLALHPPLTDRPALEAAAAQPSREAALVKALNDIQWKSADKDNMEFSARITTWQMDELNALLMGLDTPAKDERRCTCTLVGNSFDNPLDYETDKNCPLHGLAAAKDERREEAK